MHPGERRLAPQLCRVEKTAVLHQVIALEVSAGEGLPFGKPDHAPEIEEAVVDDASQHDDKTQMKHDHAEGYECDLPAPYPAEKAAGDIDHQENQYCIEPDRAEYQPPGFRAPPQ